MKVIFMGTPYFSVRTLEALVVAGHQICLAVTQPDKAKGRGKALQSTPVKEAGVDTGDMLLKVEVPIEADETGGSLYDKLAKAGADLLVKTLKELESGDMIPQKQGESPTPYAKMIHKEMGSIDLNRSAAKIERMVWGFDPWPGRLYLLERKHVEDLEGCRRKERRNKAGSGYGS